jgi:hypothetical protein
MEKENGTDNIKQPNSVRLFPVAPGLSFAIVHFSGVAYIRRLEMERWYSVDRETGKLEYVRSASQCKENNEMVEQRFCEDFLDNLASSQSPRIDTATAAETAILTNLGTT